MSCNNQAFLHFLINMSFAGFVGGTLNVIKM